MSNERLGLSARMMRAFDATQDHDPHELTIHDRALFLAASPIDEDDVRTFPERLCDAYTFIRERQRHVN